MADVMHVVFGYGPVGQAITAAALRRGESVRVVTRSHINVPSGVEHRRVDLTDPEAAKSATHGATVVYGSAQPAYHRWPAEFPQLQEAMLGAAAAADAVYVSAENLYMYGPHDGPLTEDLPYAAQTRKGRVRARMAEEVKQAHATGRVRTTAGRASDFYGPGVVDSAVGRRFLDPLLAGKPINTVGDVYAPHTWTYAPDFGRALVELGSQEGAWGRAWHVPSAPAESQFDFALRILRAAGREGEPKFRVAGPVLLRLVGLKEKAAAETIEMLYEFDRPFVMADSAFRETFGMEPTDPEAAATETVRSLSGS